MNDETEQRLTSYIDAGYELANHSHTHPSNKSISVNDYLLDLSRAHNILKAMSTFYVDMLWGAITHYDKLGHQYLNRSPKHVLLLHENDVAALFLGDLIDHIRDQGWQIISPRDAYKDDISKADTALLNFNKQGRVAALAYAAGATKGELRHVSENTDYLDAQFKLRKIQTNEALRR